MPRTRMGIAADADLCIYDGDPFTDIDARCLYTLVDGNIVYKAE